MQSFPQSDKPIAKGIRLVLIIGSVLSTLALAISIYSDLRSEAFGLRPQLAALITAVLFLTLFLYNSIQSHLATRDSPDPVASLISILMEDCVAKLAWITKLHKHNFGMYIVRFSGHDPTLVPIATHNIDPLDALARFSPSRGAFAHAIRSLSCRTARARAKSLSRLLTDSVDNDRLITNVSEIITVPVVHPSTPTTGGISNVIAYLVLLVYQPDSVENCPQDETRNCLNRYAHAISNVLQFT